MDPPTVHTIFIIEIKNDGNESALKCMQYKVRVKVLGMNPHPVQFKC